MLAIIVFQSCHHADGPLPFPGNYIVKMSGQRHWQGVDSGYEDPPPPNVTTSFKHIIDDHFALVVNPLDSTVYCPASSQVSPYGFVSGKHKYFAFDSVSHTIKFKSYIQFVGGTYGFVPYNNFIVYHYDNNSIEMFGSDDGVYSSEGAYIRTTE